MSSYSGASGEYVDNDGHDEFSYSDVTDLTDEKSYGIDGDDDIEYKLTLAEEKLDMLRIYAWHRGLNLFTSYESLFGLAELMPNNDENNNN